MVVVVAERWRAGGGWTEVVAVGERWQAGGGGGGSWWRWGARETHTMTRGS